MPTRFSDSAVDSDGPRLVRAFRALGAVLALLFLGACGTQADSVAPTVGDHAAPRVALRKTAGGDSVLAFAVDAADDLGVKTVHVRLTGGVKGVYDTTFTSAVTTVSIPFSILVSRAVPTGSIVTVVADAVDGATNQSRPDTLALVVGNVTPPKVNITGPAAGTLFVVGKSGVISLSARSQLRVRAVGFTTSGPYVSADSTVFKAPLRDSVALLDTIAIPDTAKAGVLVVTPFVIDSLGQRAAGDPVTYSVQPLSAVNSIPVVSGGLARRAEIFDTVRVAANDPTGITRLGYEVRTLGGALVAADSVAASGRLTAAENTFTWRLRATPPTQLVVRTFAVNGAGRRSYALLASGGDRADTTLLVAGLTRGLPNGGRLADAIYMPRWDRLYLTNIERNQLEVFSLADTQFLAPILVGSRPWGIAPWPRDRSGAAGDTLLVANSGGTNVSYVDLRRGSTGREVYRYPLPNIHVCKISTVTLAGGAKGYQRLCADFSDRPQFLASTCSVAQDDGTCQDAVLVYSTTPTPGQTPPFANKGTVRWENLTNQTSHLVYEHSLGIAPAADTIEILRYAQQGVGADSALVPFQQWAHGWRGDSVQIALSTVWSEIGFRDSTFVRNSGNFQRAIIGEGGSVKGSRAVRYDATVGMAYEMPVGDGTTYQLTTPMIDLGVSHYFFISDYIANAFSTVRGVAINFDGALSAIRADSTYLIDNNLRLQGLMQTSGGSNAGFDFHPFNTGLNSATPSTRLAFSASEGPQIEVFDTYCYQKVGVIEVRDPIVGPIKSSVRPDGRLVLVGASATGVITVTVDRPFTSSCAAAGVRLR